MNTLNLTDFCLVTGEAEESYSKTGSLIAKGQNHLRLHLNIFNIQISRFDIKCYEKKPALVKTSFIGNPLNIYLDLKDCAARLHLSKEQIKSENFFENNKWKRKLKKIERLLKITNHYKTIIKNYREGINPQDLIPYNTDDMPIFQKKALMKVLSLYHKVLQPHELPVSFILKFPEKMIDKYRLSRILEILTFASKEETYQLINISHKKLLVKGSFGVVFKVQNISLGLISVMKEARTHYSEHLDSEPLVKLATFSITKEFNNLKQLESLSLTKGIQKAPYFMFQTSYVGYYYNKGDLIDFINKIPFENRLSLLKDSFENLFHALNSLHELDIVHLDIKPDNIFVETDEEGKFQLCLGDMSTLQRSKNQESKLPIGIHTPSYSPFEPCYDGVYSVKKLKSFDVYQLGASIVTTLTDTPPYFKKNSQEDYPDLSLEFDDSILAKTCPKCVIQLLKAMCHPNDEIRFTIKEVLIFIKNPAFYWTRRIFFII